MTSHPGPSAPTPDSTPDPDSADQETPESDPPRARLQINPDRILDDAVKVIRRLHRHGHKAYLVGGCVRDLLLNEIPKDFDIATGARPRQVRRLFRNSQIIGRRFRLVHIRFGDRVLDVATFRRTPPKDEDDPYVRQDNAFGTEREDAFRRDFTINGLFYDVINNRVIDHVGGLEDLAIKRMRTIGPAEERIQEDPVRVLRAARFAGRLGFTLSEDLAAAARKFADDLRKGAPPRVLEELYRLVTTRGARHCFVHLEGMGALEPILPEVRPLDDWYLEALERGEDFFGGRREVETQWMAAAIMLAPAAFDVMRTCDRKDLDLAVADTIGPLAHRLTIARRDSTRARLCLAAQARLAELPDGRPARRLAQRDFFRDAITLRRILGPLFPSEQDAEVLAAWEEFGKDAAGGPRKRPKKRRRRRKRPLHPDATPSTNQECEPTSPSSSAPVPKNPPAASPPDSSNDDS